MIEDEDVELEGIDFVVCLECKKKLKRITKVHLQSKFCSRNVKDINDYRDKYKNSSVICHKSKIRKSKSQIGDGNPSWKSGLYTREAIIERKKFRFVPLKLVQYCECGCGNLTKPNKRFINGHNGFNSAKTDVQKSKIKESRNIPDYIEKQRRKKIEWYANVNNKNQIDEINNKIKSWWYNPKNKDKVIEKAKKHSMMLKGRVSEKKGKTWEQIMGEEVAENNKDKRRRMMEDRIKDDQEKWSRVYKDAGKKGGLKSSEINRKNRPYIWNLVSFFSEEEMKCAKLILSEPKEGINCHVKVGSKIIDFFPQSYDRMYQGCFVEYHPWDRKRTFEEYKKERQIVIDNSNYKGTKLILLVSDYKVV